MSSWNDKPLHLSDLSIVDKNQYTEASVTVPVWVPQSHLDGLQALIHYLDGLGSQNGNRQYAPGQMDLIMHYRSLV